MRKSLILFLFVVVVSAATLRPTRITVVGELPESTKLSLESEGIACQSDGNMTVLEIWDQEAAVRALARSYVALTRHKYVFENNIANCHTTKSADGTPYRRLFQTLNEDGSAGAIEEDSGDFNWVYDPVNPDAVQDGVHKGYLAVPNINLIQEHCGWTQADSSQRMVREMLGQLEPGLVFSNQDSGLDPTARDRVDKFCEEQRRSIDPTPWGMYHSLPDPRPMSTIPSGAAANRALQRLNELTLQSLPTNDRLFDPSWCVAQKSDIMSGVASVACALNWLNGKKAYTGQKIEEKYGFALLYALKSESASLDFDWCDHGNLSKDNWPLIVEALSRNLPVVVALGDQADGRGRVILLVKTYADDVVYANPATGELAYTTRQALLAAPSHPDGNFVFIPSRPSDFDEFGDGVL